MNSIFKIQSVRLKHSVPTDIVDAMPIGRPKNPDALSTEPRQIRNRLRRGKFKKEDWDLYQDLVIGKRIEDWDLEELARGRPRTKAGDFRGPTPKWITPPVQQEIKRRLLHEVHGMLGEHLKLAVEALGDLIKSDEVDDNGKPIVDARTKFAASTFIIEHFIGKPKALIELELGNHTKNAIAAAIVMDDGRPQDNMVIEGEYEEVEENEEESEDDDFR